MAKAEKLPPRCTSGSSASARWAAICASAFGAEGCRSRATIPNPAVTDVPDLAALVAALPSPRVVWIMVPSGAITDSVIKDVSAVLEKGDLVIDGGNSRYTDDTVHAGQLAELGIRFVDCGVSGGIWGLENGYGMMAGGEKADITKLLPVFDALRPEGPRAEGFVHAGDVGAGHYAKMVHNGIEYALMQAWAEGFELMEARSDLIHDVPGVFKAWQRGTVVRSWLLELLVKALEEDPQLARHRGLRRRLRRRSVDRS